MKGEAFVSNTKLLARLQRDKLLLLVASVLVSGKPDG